MLFNKEGTICHENIKNSHNIDPCEKALGIIHLVHT